LQRYAKALWSLDTIIKPANGAAAIVGAFLAGWINELSASGKFWAFILFFAIIVADWISGTAAAKRTITYRSDYGIAAVMRTMLLLWIPFIGWLLDKVSDTVFSIHQPGLAYYGLTFMLAYHSWVSVTANCYRAGWGRWIPKGVLDYVSSEIKAKAERALSMKGRG
jgi:phage-related holin